jgi:DNA-binding NarL/FixJ family response regulator
MLAHASVLAPKPSVSDDWTMLTTDAPAAPVRVLIVDDQAPFRDAARLVVEMADQFEVVAEVDSAEAALDVIDEAAPDMVLMDVQMAGMSGFEGTRHVLARRPDCVVLVLSTYDGAEYDESAREAGAVGFVSKADLTAELLSATWVARASASR